LGEKKRQIARKIYEISKHSPETNKKKECRKISSKTGSRPQNKGRERQNAALTGSWALKASVIYHSSL
jgi:hypothetical protein